jgi:transglutaminase-like putative cysteine protease
MKRHWPVEAGLLGSSIAGAFALSRLAAGASAATITTAAVGTIVVAALRRSSALGVAVGVVAVALSSLWWGLRIVAHFGLPTPSGLRTIRYSLQSSRATLAGFHLPLAHSAGIVVLCALIGGMVAVASRAIGSRYPALSLTPAGALVVWSAILLPSTGAALAGLALAASGMVVLVSEGSRARRTSVALTAASLGIASLTLGWAAVAGSGEISPSGQTGPAVAPSALSLATDLTGVETRDANVVLFRAKTPVSTYWQVTALTVFAGDQWVPDPATAALLNGSTPPRSPVPPVSQHLFGSRVVLATYDGRLLPAPPATITASGDSSPVVTPSGVVATAPLHSGSTYTVNAVVPSPVPDFRASAPSEPSETATGPLPASVRSLALAITGSQSTPKDKAEALTDFFRSGQFHYTISPPRPAGSDPLVSFLTQTRTGSCEQFAGAFAVLARASGLSTRVAVGFTPGRPANGITVVRGSDAHAWPQVLINGSWVSFEPTPQLPSGELSPPGVLGPSGLGQPNPTGPGSHPPVSIPIVTAPHTTVPPITAPVAPPTAVPAHRTGSGVGWWIALLLVLAIAGAAAAVALRRRHRALIAKVVASWEAIDQALARHGMPRPSSRTPMGHIRFLSEFQRNDQAIAAVDDMVTVAAVLEDATYGSGELLPDDVDRVVRASRRVRHAVRVGALSGGPAPGFEVHEARQLSKVNRDQRDE